MNVFIKDLENALNCLQREDPSLKVRVDPDSGQVGTTMGGVGTLLKASLHNLLSASLDNPVWDGRVAHRDHPRSDPSGIWHRDLPGTAAGGLQRDYPERGLGHRCGLPAGVIHIVY